MWSDHLGWAAAWSSAPCDLVHWSCLDFQDLAMYINEVKRDKETLKKISEFQCSIENLVSRWPFHLAYHSGCLWSLTWSRRKVGHGMPGFQKWSSTRLHPFQPTRVLYTLRWTLSRAEEMETVLLQT